MKLGSRRTQLIGFPVLALALASGAFLLLQQRGGEPAEAIAAGDSTAVDADSEEREEPPVPVELATAALHDIPAYFNASGSLEAQRRVDLVSKAGGQIMRLGIEEGDFVKKGQILLRIDHREEDLLLEQARVQSETAQRELDRIEGLVAKGLGSEKDLEEHKERARVAELERDLAEVRRDNKVVHAPFAGQVTVRHVELGQTVNVGTSLVSLADISPLEVRIYLPEKIVRDLAPGQPVEIRSDLDAQAPWVGTVSRIAPAVDPATSTVKITLEVKNPSSSARVGSFVRARITTDVHRDVVAVPKKALVPEAGITYVFLAEADTVRKIPITTGYADDDFIEITSGLRAGEHVVSVGQGGLRPGSKIRDLNEEEADSEEEADAAEAADSDPGLAEARSH